MNGSIIGAGMAAAGSILGGMKASRAARKAKREVEAQRVKNQNWYDQRMNEDATQRADAQRLLTMTEERIRNRNNAAAGRQAVMGGTDESVAATKEANNNAMAQTASAINASADQRKDAVEEQYRQNDDNYSRQLQGIENQRAQNVAAATSGVVSAAGKIASALDTLPDKKAGNGDNTASGNANGNGDGTATGSTDAAVAAAEQDEKKPSKE